MDALMELFRPFPSKKMNLALNVSVNETASLNYTKSVLLAMLSGFVDLTKPRISTYLKKALNKKFQFVLFEMPRGLPPAYEQELMNYCDSSIGALVVWPDQNLHVLHQHAVKLYEANQREKAYILLSYGKSQIDLNTPVCTIAEARVLRDWAYLELTLMKNPAGVMRAVELAEKSPLKDLCRDKMLTNLVRAMNLYIDMRFQAAANEVMGLEELANQPIDPGFISLVPEFEAYLLAERICAAAPDGFDYPHALFKELAFDNARTLKQHIQAWLA